MFWKIDRTICLTALLFALVCPLRSAQAQQTLRWKFAQGDKHIIEIKQFMQMDMKIGEQPLQMKITQNMTLERVVEAVDAEGNARITQQFQRVIINADGPGGFAYDTASMEEPAPAAAPLAPLFRALVESPLAMTITPLGAVQDVEIPPALLEAASRAPALGIAQELFTQDGLTQLMKQSSLEFPVDAVQQGTQWRTELGLKNPQIGTQIITTTYTYQGQEKAGGKQLEQLGVSTRFVYEDTPPAVEIAVTKQSSDGKLLFDNAVGELLSSQVNAKLTLSVKAAGNDITQEITTRTDLKARRAEAAQPE